MGYAEYDSHDDINNGSPGGSGQCPPLRFFPETTVSTAWILQFHWLTYWVTAGHATKSPPPLLLLCRVPNEDRPKLDGGRRTGEGEIR